MAEIGPNAILQLLPLIERDCGRAGAAAIRRRAGLRQVPDGHSMIAEEDAVGLHRALRREAPSMAARLAAEAGTRTADYLLANRIPRPVQVVLRALPAGLAARLLSRAIARNAWTFAGSGRFRVVDPWTFEIDANPFVRGERGPSRLCHWHAAVFTRLYATLVHPASRCRETRCAARDAGDVCRFEISRPGAAAASYDGA